MKNVNKNRHDFFKLYDKFLKETQQGKRLQKNGRRIRKSSIEHYFWLRKLLLDFSVNKKFPLYVCNLNYQKKREVLAESKYWKKFYDLFTEYLYDDLCCYDNYVGTNIKRLRAFFNYLKHEKNMNIGSFYNHFYVHTEEIGIITLLPEQLNFLIFNKEFENKLPDHLRKTKDTFVFGCTVALRFSDIFNLTSANIESINSKHYLKVRSQKTGTYTRVLLPDYAIEIIKKKNIKHKTIFEPISKNQFNKNLKLLMELAGWTHPEIKTRTRRGIPIEVYKNEKTKTSFRFCDLITSHTMRRTAITTMLCLKMPENLVRKISGHAPGSKEFFRYVQLSQFYIDSESEKIFEQIKQKELQFA